MRRAVQDVDRVVASGDLTVELIHWYRHGSGPQAAGGVCWNQKSRIVPGDTGHVELVQVVDNALDGDIGGCLIHLRLHT